MESNDFKFEVPDFNGGIKKLSRTIASNGSLIVAMLAIIVASMVFFTDIDGGFQINASFSPSLVILFSCCVIEYFSTKQMGTAEGMREECYIKAMKEHRHYADESQKCGGIEQLGRFCSEYAKNDLRRRKISLLNQVGMEYDEYESKYMLLSKRELPSSLPRTVKKAVVTANAMKAIKLSQDNLLFFVAEDGMKLLLSPNKKERMRDVSFIVPTVISTFFAASLVIEVAQNLSFATVAACLVKVLCIVLNGVKGYQNGYYNIVDDHVQCANARVFLLKEYLSWAEKAKTEAKAPAPVNVA